MHDAGYRQADVRVLGRPNLPSVCIDRLYRAGEDTAALAEGPQVVYVSPLKALAVDIHQNLEAPLREIAEVAAELGLEGPHIRVAVRTGDTAASERAAGYSSARALS